MDPPPAGACPGVPNCPAGGEAAPKLGVGAPKVGAGAAKVEPPEPAPKGLALGAAAGAWPPKLNTPEAGAGGL